MANRFAIVLAENKQVFQPGETISGALLLNTDKEIEPRYVRVALHGLAKVRIGKNVRRETYLDEHQTLLGGGKSDFFKYRTVHIYCQAVITV